MHSYDIKRQENTATLSGEWRFITDRDRTLSYSLASAKLGDCAATQQVPSIWNTVPELFDYDGVCWYECDFVCDGGRKKLLFEGVCNDAEVWLDGERILSHEGAYLAFSAYVDLDSGTHRLTVRVSNEANNEDTLPARRRDWKRYGGIIRPVRLISLPNEYIDQMQVSYTLSDDLESAKVDTRVKFYGKNAAKYTLSLNGEPVGDYTFTEGENLISFKLADVKLWDIAAPHLYNITLENGYDSETVRTGFRKIGIKDGRITLNGRPIVLKGVNRHEERYDCGHALPRSATVEDIELVTELGANTVRGSHYPNSREFLDLCDERGILFWCELPLWQFGEAQGLSPELEGRILSQGAR